MFIYPIILCVGLVFWLNIQYVKRLRHFAHTLLSCGSCWAGLFINILQGTQNSVDIVIKTNRNTSKPYVYHIEYTKHCSNLYSVLDYHTIYVIIVVMIDVLIYRMTGRGTNNRNNYRSWGSLYQDPLLLTWFNFNPSKDKYLHPLYTVGWNYLSIPKLQWLHRWILGMDK